MVNTSEDEAEEQHKILYFSSSDFLQILWYWLGRSSPYIQLVLYPAVPGIAYTIFDDLSSMLLGRQTADFHIWSVQ